MAANVNPESLKLSLTLSLISRSRYEAPALAVHCQVLESLKEIRSKEKPAPFLPRVQLLAATRDSTMLNCVWDFGFEVLARLRWKNGEINEDVDGDDEEAYAKKKKTNQKKSPGKGKKSSSKAKAVEEESACPKRQTVWCLCCW